MRLWIVCLAACGFEGRTGDPSGDARLDTPGSTGSWLDGYAYRKPVSVRYAGPTLMDFPVGILVDSDGDLAVRARPDGADFVVAAVDGTTRLDSETVAFDTGTLELWTRVPSLPDGTTTLYLYYGGAPASTSPTGVWSQRYAGVWHLSDLGTGARDSTAAQHHLAAPSMSSEPSHAPGAVGTARESDGDDDELAVPDPADGSLDFPTASFSYSIWIRQTSVTAQYDVPLWKGGTSSSEPGYCFMRDDTSWSAKLHDGSRFINADLATPAAGEWAHFVAVVDRGANRVRMFTNGVATDPGRDITQFGSLAATQRFNVGLDFNGRIDEARVYTGALPSEWIAAEHANLANPDFVELGVEETR